MNRDEQRANKEARSRIEVAVKQVMDTCLQLLEDQCDESLQRSVNRLQAELLRRQQNATGKSNVWSLYTQNGPDYLV
jgi:flagellar basal body-associated protein FliL